jgi:hypothetical protein
MRSKNEPREARESHGTTASMGQSHRGTTTIRRARQRTPASIVRTRMPFRSNIVVDSRDAGTHEDDNRALVRHERD